MKHLTLTLEEMKEKTRTMFNLSETDDLSFIDEDFLNANISVDNDISATLIPSPNYGYNVAYGHRTGVGPTYEFYGGAPNWATNINSACAGGRWWLAQSLWNHRNLDNYCGGSSQPAFRRIAEFTFNG